MRFDVVTLFPEFFGGPLATGLVGKAIQNGSATVAYVDPRTFTTDRHHTVDDDPYGGGGGMVMKPEPLAAAIAEARSRGGGPVLLMSPQGRPLVQASFARWSRRPHLVIVAGRYEGYDERVRALCDEEVSIGDFVLTGGEYAALVIIDGVVRLLPGTLGNEGSAEDDSFSKGLLEFPHYTRPPEFRGEKVPDVLMSGDHAKIAEWRRARSLERTKLRRPDLLAERAFTREERLMLEAARSKLPPIELAIAVRDAGELEALLRLTMVYDLAKLHVVLEGSEVAPPPQRIVIHKSTSQTANEKTPPPVGGSPPAKAGPPEDPRQSGPAPEPSRLVVHSSSLAFARSLAVRRDSVALIASSSKPSLRAPTMPPAKIVELARASSRSIVLAIGSRLDAAGPPDALLPSLRVTHTANALPPATAAAILLDRLIGEG